MQYRVDNGSTEYKYRKTLAGAIAAAKGSGRCVISQRLVGHHAWVDAGVVVGNEWFDGRQYVDALTLLRSGWRYTTTSLRDKKFGFAEILETGEIEFPRKQCGLDNMLITARRVGAIREGEKSCEQLTDGVYHYVVTGYGRFLAVIIATWELQAKQ